MIFLFKIWANTKICGDTLLLKIDYNVIEPFDNITIFVRLVFESFSKKTNFLFTLVTNVLN